MNSSIGVIGTVVLAFVTLLMTFSILTWMGQGIINLFKSKKDNSYIDSDKFNPTI